MADRFVRSIRLWGLFPRRLLQPQQRHATATFHTAAHTSGQTDVESETAFRTDASSVATANSSDSGGREMRVFAVTDEPHAAH